MNVLLAWLGYPFPRAEPSDSRKVRRWGAVLCKQFDRQHKLVCLRMSNWL